MKMSLDCMRVEKKIMGINCVCWKNFDVHLFES